MSNIGQPAHATDEGRAKALRIAINIGAALQVLIWFCLIVYIWRHSNPMGDGMEWVAVMPATFILAVGAIPALAFRSKERLLPVGVLLAGVGVLLNAAFFLRIAREFAESAQ